LTTGRDHNPGYWKNGIWNALTPYNPTGLSEIFAITISGTDVYVGGYNGLVDGTVAPILWKNGNIVNLSQPEGITNAMVSSIAVFGTDVYASGVNIKDSNWFVGYWKNGEWVQLSDFGLAGSIIVVQE
jgi:hypothetical protein